MEKLLAKRSVSAYRNLPVAEVAQLVEHLVVAQVAVGSSPIFRPINICPASVSHDAGFSFGAWRSLVAHLLWEQGVASSSPAAPTSMAQ